MPQDINLALNNSLLVFLIILFFSVSACSSTGGTQTFIPQPVESGMTVVYLYRPTVISNAVYSPDLYINKEYKISIENGKNSRLLLSPGDNIFELETDRAFSGLTSLSLNLAPGTTYYLRLDTSLRIENDTNYKPYQRNFILVKVDEKSAIKQIIKCCMKENENTTNISENLPSTEIHRDEFSVDKTQNPFSH